MTNTSRLCHWVLAVTLVAGCSGCSTPHYVGPQETSGASSFAVRLSGMVIDGKMSTDSAGSRMCTLQIDPAKKSIHCDGDVLIPLRREDDVRYTFFHPKLGSEVGICLEPSHGELPVVSYHLGPGGFSTCRIGGIQPRSIKVFTQQFESVKIPASYQGFVAKTRFVDGTPVRLERQTFVGFVLGTQGGWSFNGDPAKLYRCEVSPGKKVLFLSNGSEEGIIWPDGSWLLRKFSDPGISFCGSHKAFQELYIRLREQALEKQPSEDELQHLRRVPNNLKEYGI